MPDTDLLEQDQEIESGQVEQQQDEPQTSLPDRAAGEKTQSRQELIDATLEEGAADALQESIIEELGDVSKHPELSLEDLRKIPGAEGLSDDQLKAQWAQAVKTAQGGQTAEQTDQTFKLPFPIYDKAGNKIEALEKISVKDLLEGNLQVGYNALGKEQRKTLAEALRNASMGHFNEQKYNTTVQERNRVATEAAELRKQVEQFTTERQIWDAALTALTMGNAEPMKKLAEAYQKAITSMPSAAPGMVSIEQVRQEREQEAAGQRFLTETIIPASMEIAQRYGANQKEVYNAIEWFLKQDLEFLTKEKVDSILQIEIPHLLEANGYSPTSGQQTQQTQQTSEVEQLKQTVAALQQSIAEAKNSKTQTVREKTKKAPPSGGGATPGAGDSMPSFKSRSQMKAWMQGDPDWQKA